MNYVRKFEYALEVAEFALDTGMPSTTIVAGYDIIRDVLKWMLVIEPELEIESIELPSPEYDGYDKEYLLCIENEGVWVEPAYLYEKDIYLEHDTDLLMVCSNNSARIIEKADYAECMLFSIEADTCDGDCEHCAETSGYIQESNDQHGFTRSWTDGIATYHESFYSTDIDLVREMLSRIN